MRYYSRHSSAKALKFVYLLVLCYAHRNYRLHDIHGGRHGISGEGRGWMQHGRGRIWQFRLLAGFRNFAVEWGCIYYLRPFRLFARFHDVAVEWFCIHHSSLPAYLFLLFHNPEFLLGLLELQLFLIMRHVLLLHQRWSCVLELLRRLLSL